MPKTSGSFKKGVSGNPNGAAIGLFRQLRELYAKDVPAIFGVLVEIAQGRGPLGVELKGSDVVKACELVLNRLVGTPKIDLEVSTTSSAVDWSKLSITERRTALELMAKANALEAGDGE